MPLAEIEKIRAKSDLFAKRNSGPWVEWFTQMVKKSVIKRASKTWPYTGHSGRLFEAIELANVSEGGYTLDDERPKAITVAGGRPTDGMRMADMPEDRRPELQRLVAEIMGHADAGRLNDALTVYQRDPMEHEERSAVFGELASHHRTSIKRLLNATRQPKEAVKLVNVFHGFATS